MNCNAGSGPTKSGAISDQDGCEQCECGYKSSGGHELCSYYTCQAGQEAVSIGAENSELDCTDCGEGMWSAGGVALCAKQLNAHRAINQLRPVPLGRKMAAYAVD